MADTQNPNQEHERNRHTQNPPPTNPHEPKHERPMDDPGRGQGDKLEDYLPGQRQPGESQDS